MSFKVLGIVPRGGFEDVAVLPGIDVKQHHHEEILMCCVALMRSAEAAAKLGKDAKAGALGAPFEEGVWNMGGSYDREVISGLDVMIYICRVVQRLLTLLGHTHHDFGPNNWETMAEVSHNLATEVYKLASVAGLHKPGQSHA